MSKFSYTYRTIKYVHDPVVGEALNVGVILFAPSLPWVGILTESRFSRLSKAFRGFHRDSYRSTLRLYELAIKGLLDSWKTELPGVNELPSDIVQVTNVLSPDPNLTFQFGDIRAGVATNPEHALDQIFQRMVLSQAPGDSEGGRSDNDVWNKFRVSLHSRSIDSALMKKSFQSDRVDMEFDHAFKNGAWHVLQPLSFDLKDPQSIQRKAAVWVGYSSGLEDQPDLGTIYLLLGRPGDGEAFKAYKRAKALLEKVPLEHKLVEEEEAEDFARDLAKFMQKHGLLTSPTS